MCRGRGGCITLSFAANVDVVSLSAAAAAPAVAATAAAACFTLTSLRTSFVLQLTATAASTPFLSNNFCH